jgi:hypothetical protein
LRAWNVHLDTHINPQERIERATYSLVIDRRNCIAFCHADC